MKKSKEIEGQLEETEKQTELTTERTEPRSEFIPWKMARELGKDSYQMALRREQIIDDKFSKLTTFITVIIATVAFLMTNFDKTHILKQSFSLYIFVRMVVPWKVLFAIVIFLLFVILFISILGQYGYKKDYLHTSMDLLNDFEKAKDEYTDINPENFAFVDQYEKIHKSLNKVLNKKARLLDVSHILMFVVTVLIMIIFMAMLFK
ncbi:hypothetical protein VN91_1863 [Lactococcus lactis subsp. lactis]|nr:hypothetical protein VN91_1863 [Lactococcus lactis subsp. lactis]